MRINVTTSDTGWPAALARPSLRPTLDSIARDWSQTIRDRTATGRAVDGAPFPPKRDGAPSTLRATGGMLRAFGPLTVDDAGFRLGFRDARARKLAYFHQHGKGKGRVRRPFVGVDDATDNRRGRDGRHGTHRKAIMKTSQTLEIRASEIRQRLNEIAGLGELSPEVHAESDKLTEEHASVETRRRAALVAEDAEVVETHATQTIDAEGRERLRLRDRCTFGGYLQAAMAGRLPGGALAEYGAACGVEDGQVPLDLFDRRPAAGRRRTRTPSAPAPATGQGSTLHPIQPYVFAESIAARLGISMPSVGSGSHSWARISTALTAGARAKGTAQESTAAALTSVTASPRRISARLSVEIEDVAQIGSASFEPALRSNLTGGLSDAYDVQCISGSGQAPNVLGLMKQLTVPTKPTVGDRGKTRFSAQASTDLIDDVRIAVIPPCHHGPGAGGYAPAG